MTAPRSSGGTCSPSFVKPTRSPKQTVTSCEPASRPARELGGADHVVAELLAEVMLEDVLEHRADHREQALGRRHVAPRGLELGVARLQHRLADQALARRRELRHRHPEDARDLEQPLGGEAGLELAPDPARRLHVLLGEGPLVGLGHRQAERLAKPAEEIEVDPGALGDLLPSEPLPLPSSSRSTGSSARRSSSTARRSSSSGTPSPRAPRAAPAVPREPSPGPAKQPLGLEVDRHARDSPSPGRRPS